MIAFLEFLDKEGRFDKFWNKIQTLLILDPWVQRGGGRLQQQPTPHPHSFRLGAQKCTAKG